MRGQTTDATMQHDYLAAKYRQIRASFDDEVIVYKASIEREAAYYLALELVRLIEPSPNSNGSWCVSGVWWHSLGATVRAILAEAAQ